MATIKNLWSVHSAGGADSGGEFTFKEFDSSWVGADPTYLGVPLTDGDTIPWNSSNVIINSAGRYEFDYQVSTVNCASATARLILYLYEVDISDTPGSCNYTGEFKSDLFTGDTVTNDTQQDDTDVTWIGQYEILDCDLNQIYFDNYSSTQSGPTVSAVVTAATWAVGGYIDTVKIHDESGTEYFIDLSAVTYTGNVTTFQNAIFAEFESQMTALGGYVNGVDYDLQSVTVTTGGFYKFQMVMGCKHNPSSTWFGIDSTDSEVVYYDDGVSVNTSNSVNPTIIGPTIIYSESIPCGTMTYFAQLASTFSANYNDLVRNAEEPLNVITDTSPITCNFTELTGTLFPACEVLESYSWAGPSGYSSTDQTIQVDVAGSYTCTIQCGSTICNHTIVI